MNTIDFLRQDGSIIVNKRLATCIGIESAIMFSELVSRYDYFEKKGQLSEGFFFNTIEDLEEATTLSEYQQTKAIKNLVKLKLIEKKLKGLPAKRYFKICEFNVLETLLNRQLPKNSETCYKKNKKLATKKLGTNNTNINNTNEIILKNLNVVVANRTDVNFFNNFFIYYLQVYEYQLKQKHPVLKVKSIETIVDNIETFASEYDIVTLQKWKEIVDYYFRCDLDCDRNILHFSNYEILYNRADNLRLLENDSPN